MACLSSASMATRRWRVRSPARPSVIVRALALGVTYAMLAALIVVVTAFGETSGATFWPGAGLTLAVLLHRPTREWPIYLVAVGIAETCVDLWAGYGVPVALGFALANTLEPLVAAVLLRRGGRPEPDFGKRADLARFIAFGIVVGPFVGALVGTAVGVLFAGDPWMPRLSRWYLGDAIAVLVVAPALLILWRPRRQRMSREALPSLAMLALVTACAMAPWQFPAATGLPFLVVPLLTVIAMRLGLGGAAAGVLVLAAIIEAGTASGRGPFTDDGGAFHGLVVAQMFLAMCTVTTYLVAVLAGELTTGSKLEAELRAQALRDSLTGLANRRLLFDRIEQASRRLARHPGTLALLFIDLDAFKLINDSHGHAAGDLVLVQSADRLRDVVRDHDSIARIGGDEFLILAEDLRDPTDAHELAARVVRVFDEPFDAPSGPIHVSASVGVATTTVPISDPEAYLAGADRAMYIVKRAGGHGVAAASAL